MTSALLSFHLPLILLNEWSVRSVLLNNHQFSAHKFLFLLLNPTTMPQDKIIFTYSRTPILRSFQEQRILAKTPRKIGVQCKIMIDDQRPSSTFTNLLHPISPSMSCYRALINSKLCNKNLFLSLNHTFI